VSDSTSSFISLADLFRAYRKAKADAFFDGIHGDPLAYVKYEKSLEKNLRALLQRLTRGDWQDDLAMIGGYAFVPKAIQEPKQWSESILHFSTSAQGEDWADQFKASGGQLADASFRLIIRATVDFQIISALWILKVGEKYEAKLDNASTYGNRLRRHFNKNQSSGPINEDCAALFVPYFGGYRAWRQKGLESIRSELTLGHQVAAVTMDVRRFYHNVSPEMLLDAKFNALVGVFLSEEEMLLNRQFIASIVTWYRSTPDHAAVPGIGALPVGLSASKVIANVSLIEFDRIVRQKIKPAYYGRYVDDIFLVTQTPKPIKSGKAFLRWIVSHDKSRLSLTAADGQAPTLIFAAPYTRGSRIEFAGDKQKIFMLKGRSGLDLVDQIEEQIKKHSSEYRLLATLPDSEGEMLSSAFLATPDATIEADALRKADVISVRRLGFALLLSDMEAHERDLGRSTWRSQRELFYGLVLRHVLTPKGFFNYYTYLNRVFGLMVACEDAQSAIQFIDRFHEVANLIKRTSTAGKAGRGPFQSCVSLYGHVFMRAAIQSATVHNFKFSDGYFRVLRHLSKTFSIPNPGARRDAVRSLAVQVLRCDLGRRAYKEFWFSANVVHKKQPRLPTEMSVKKVLRLGGIRRFRKQVAAGLRPPYWPAIAFPTRPLTAAEVIYSAPSLLGNEFLLQQAIFSLRGAGIDVSNAPRVFTSPEGQSVMRVVGPSHDSYRVAVTNFESLDPQWMAALNARPDLSLKRYQRVNSLINSILTNPERPSYVLFPEASLPKRWAIRIAMKLAKSGISFVAGTESWTRKRYPFRNEALISLCSSWPGYRSHLLYSQPKIRPAYAEGDSIREAGRTFYLPNDIDQCRPVYFHGDHFFSVLICSDMTDLDNRQYLRGAVDSVFVLEWNRDINSFSSLVEAATLDVHCYVVQVNNRAYGDSRVRSPRVATHERDVVRVKGGDSDYFVVATLASRAIRSFHQLPNGSSGKFKAVPIGFNISTLRRNR
jgi:hypothetical protein